MRFIQNNKVVAHPLDDGEVIENPAATDITPSNNNNTQNEINSTSNNAQQQQQLSSTPSKQTQQTPDASTIIQNPATTTSNNNNAQEKSSSSTTKQTPGNKALEGVDREALEKGGEPLTQVHTKKTKCCICCTLM